MQTSASVAAGTSIWSGPQTVLSLQRFDSEVAPAQVKGKARANALAKDSEWVRQRQQMQVPRPLQTSMHTRRCCCSKDGCCISAALRLGGFCHETLG